jgi:hypothetical protein
MEPARKSDFQTATGLMAPANEGVAGVCLFLLLGGGEMTSAEDSLVELRCAVAVIRGDAVLLVQRPDHGDWVLPGGRPRHGGYVRYLGNMWRPEQHTVPGAPVTE